MKDAKLKAYTNEKLPYYLLKFEALLQNNKYFVANKYTLVDLAMFDFVEEIDEYTVNHLAAYPLLNAHRQMVMQRPNIAAYLQSGRRTPNF